MEVVAVKTKFQVVIPQRIRKQVDVDVGDLLEARVERGKITFTPKRLIDRHLAEGLDDLKRGRTHGPYATADEAVAALESRAQGRRKKRRPRSSASPSEPIGTTPVFRDPMARIFDDEEHSQDEPREMIIGHSAKQRLILVCFTVRDTRIRIISARRAMRFERKDYEENTSQ